MIFAFLPPYIARLIRDECRKNFFLICWFILKTWLCFQTYYLKTNIYELLQKKSQINAIELAIKQLCFVCSMTSQVTFTYYLLLNSLVNC